MVCETLAELIASNGAVVDAHWRWENGADNTVGTAEAFLSTPEMEAVREVLNIMCRKSSTREVVFRALADHPLVIEWIGGGGER